MSVTLYDTYRHKHEINRHLLNKLVCGTFLDMKNV